ncbi:unnamed protein product [Symbiodinium microadriaticum]|nr:unnamed protein product [Symbiodinium microadriaticum]
MEAIPFWMHEESYESCWEELIAKSSLRSNGKLSILCTCVPAALQSSFLVFDLLLQDFAAGPNILAPPTFVSRFTAAAAAGVGCGCWWHQELQPSAHRHPSCSEATRRPGFISAALAGSAQQQSLHREILAAHDSAVASYGSEVVDLRKCTFRAASTRSNRATRAVQPSVARARWRPESEAAGDLDLGVQKDS